MSDRTIRRLTTLLAMLVVGWATLSSTGCVAPAAIARLQEAAASNEGDMNDPAMPPEAQRIARENAYVDHQACWLLDSDYERPAWVVELEAKLTATRNEATGADDGPGAWTEGQ